MHPREKLKLTSVEALLKEFGRKSEEGNILALAKNEKWYITVQKTALKQLSFDHAQQFDGDFNVVVFKINCD